MTINLIFQLRRVQCGVETWYIASNVVGENDVDHNDSNIFWKSFSLLISCLLVEITNPTGQSC
jgi:hypothetical protein